MTLIYVNDVEYNVMCLYCFLCSGKHASLNWHLAKKINLIIVNCTVLPFRFHEPLYFIYFFLKVMSIKYKLSAVYNGNWVISLEKRNTLVKRSSCPPGPWLRVLLYPSPPRPGPSPLRTCKSGLVIVCDSECFPIYDIRPNM